MDEQLPDTPWAYHQTPAHHASIREIIMDLSLHDHSLLLPWVVQRIPHVVHPYGFAFVTNQVIFSYGYTLFFAVNHWTTEAGIVDNDNVSEINWGAL